MSTPSNGREANRTAQLQVADFRPNTPLRLMAVCTHVQRYLDGKQLDGYSKFNSPLCHAKNPSTVNDLSNELFSLFLLQTKWATGLDLRFH
jgi:hypothetical protein